MIYLYRFWVFTGSRKFALVSEILTLVLESSSSQRLGAEKRAKLGI